MHPKENVSQYETQIDPSVLLEPRPDALKALGRWATDESIAEMHRSFVNADPFPHVVIQDFLSQDALKAVSEAFPRQDDPCWMLYNNPMERKLACNVMTQLPSAIQSTLLNLMSPELVNVFERISGLPTLQPDPFMHGGGIHSHPRGGKLDLHLDYSIHPVSGMERRLNLIVFVHPSWDVAYGGCLELWDKDMSCCRVKVPPMPNSAVLFSTSDDSWHGLPDPIVCPDGLSRQSLALYYLTEPRKNVTHRYKAQFVGRPFDPPCAMLDRLREIRPQRRITKEDVMDWDEKDLKWPFEEEPKRLS